ncbi:MAG: xenobiotic ABC transporter ATP-binding protein [Candidatus Binatia bacterium]|nr:MAG: xenobiotic ABC transporter ATP-binding protein [Candidatus Binatia bacterium]
MKSVQRPARTEAAQGFDAQRDEAGYDVRLLGHLWSFIRPHRWWFWAAMLTLPLATVCSLLQPYLLKLSIDRYVSAGLEAGLVRMGFIYLAALLAEAAFLYLEYYCTMVMAQRSLGDLRLRLFDHLQSLEIGYFERTPVGRVVTRLTTDIDVIQEMFAAGAMTLLTDLLTLLGIVAILVWIDWRLALVSLAVVPIMVAIVDFFRVRARESYRTIRERVARLNAYLQEAVTGMSVIQLFAQEARAGREFDARNRAHRDAYHRANIYEATLFSLVEAVGSISFAAIVWYGGGEVIRGALAFGTLVAFIEYVQRFFAPIRDFSSKYAVLQSAMAAAERVFDLLETRSVQAKIEHPVYPRTRTGRVEFRDVWFAYRDEEWVLRQVSFAVRPGERVAVVGPTGSGKTTLVKLLQRFYDPQKGFVLVEGVDTRQWDLHALRKHVGVVGQDVFLFSGTVAENIALGRPDLSRTDVERIARAVHADSFVSRLPRGFDEPVGERGANLSAGERQLLAYARALAQNPQILVLDEATSAIDPQTEALLEDAVETLVRGRTVIVIAHRLATVERADRIVVLQRGEIREEGTHAELLRQGGLYARLYELQRTAALLDFSQAEGEWERTAAS